MKEQDYQSKIVRALENNLNAYTVKVITASKRGVPDVIACIPFNKADIEELFKEQDTIGVFVAIEVKTPSTMGNTSKLQDWNILQINERGGIAKVAWSVDDALKL